MKTEQDPKPPASPPLPLYAAGDSVKLIPYHKDNRPTTVRRAGPEAVVLEESRGGYQCWNNADIEPHNAPTERQPGGADCRA
jgi:hypothetical protein